MRQEIINSKTKRLLETIAETSGSKKDFIDLYFLLQKYQLRDLLDLFDKKYKNIKYNRLHILKSLVYFEEAENEPMPKMFQKITWLAVKNKVRKEVKEII